MSENKINWSNAPPNIVEKIVYYAAQQQRVVDPLHDYFIAIENCCVNRHWKKVIFSSKFIFWNCPPHKKGVFAMKFHDSDSSAMTPYNNAARLIQEGFLSVAERLSLSDCFPIEILKNAQENSITNFWLDGFLDVQRLRLWMDTLIDLFSRSKNAEKFKWSCATNFSEPLPPYIKTIQADPTLFWRLLYTIINCNKHPKSIYLGFNALQLGKPNWSCINEFNSGFATIKELFIYDESPISLKPSCTPDTASWERFSESVKIEQLGTDQTFDLDAITVVKAESFQLHLYDWPNHYPPYSQGDIINWTKLMKYDKLIVKSYGHCFKHLIEENCINHKNMHFLWEDRFITKDYCLTEDLIKLLKVLPSSTVKTITYPGEETYIAAPRIIDNKWQVDSKEHLLLPKTTFECTESLLDDFSAFVAAGQIKYKKWQMI